MNYFKGQTKRPNKTKNENAITLVALIITIIILIILAVVTINVLTHDGLADLAIKSTQDYQKAQSDEMNMLNEIDTMVKETLKNIEDGTTKPKPDPEEPDIPTPPDFSETIEIANSNIGKTVDYTPKSGQTYSTEQEGTEYSGNTKQDFSTSDLTGGWSLWGVDDKNIYVISDNSTAVTSKSLTLQYNRGYNNGVTLLDNICNACFTDKETYPTMSARSLKLSDILEVTTVSNQNQSKYGSTPYSYSFKYPYIWDYYEKLADTDIKKREEPYSLTTQDALTSNISYKPTFTLYYNPNLNTPSAWKVVAYHKMVITPAQNAEYWLSSRYAFPESNNYCYFGLQRVYSDGVRGNTLYYYLNGSPPANSSNSLAIRPLVSFPMADYALQENGDTIKVVKRG